MFDRDRGSWWSIGLRDERGVSGDHFNSKVS